MIEYVLILLVVGAVVAVAAVSSVQYSIVEWIIFAFFLVVIAIVGAQYFFGVNITASIKQLLDGPKIDFAVVDTETSKTKTSTQKNQVFHVPGQYDYINSKALCRAYGGKLANIEQITEAYKQGGEWCDYGWSDDQMALYPTQTKTWQSFKETELHKQDCGRPGVNGGYFNNPKQKLGANCFAPKPEQKGDIKPLVVPNPPIDEAEAYWKENLPAAAPFNYDKWEQ